MPYRTSEEPTSRRVHLLLSDAVRYPEITAVRYDPRRQTMRLSFLILGPRPEGEVERAELKLREMLEVYHMLQQIRPLALSVLHEGMGELTALSVERDVATLTPEEIYTVVEAVRDLFPERVVAEPMEYVGEDELLAQDEMIEELLASLEQKRSSANLIAIREDGRVMFFQK